MRLAHLCTSDVTPQPAGATVPGVLQAQRVGGVVADTEGRT